MKKRSVSAFFIVLILGIAIYCGGYLFEILMGLCAILGFREFVNIRKKGNKNSLNCIELISLITLLLMVFNNVFYTIDSISLLGLPILLLTIPIVIYNNKDKYSINDCFYLFGVIFILGIAFNSLILFRDKDIWLCIYVFLISFMTDTYAYIGGMLIGRNKLTSISPKKTIEGSIVGSVMATFLGTCFYNILINDIGLMEIMLVSFCLSVISQFGDLFFSSIKRYYDKKDYSNLIPGHGGILDRLDSVIFVTIALNLVLNIL